MDLNATKILGAEDTSVVSMEVPEWGGVLYIRVLDGPDRDALAARLLAINASGGQNPALACAEIVARGACSASGEPLFGPQQVGALHRKNPAVLERVAMRICEHNGMTAESHGAAVKNS